MYFIATVFVVWAQINLKKCVLFWCVFSIVLNISFCIKYTPPAITVTFLINVYLIFVFFIKKHKRAKQKTPIIVPVVFVIVSYIITFLFADLNSNVNVLLSLFVNEFVILYIFYFYVETKNDIKYVLKIGFVILIISIIYAFITLLLQDNPIINWESGLSGDIVKVVVANQTERGMKLQSLFSSATDFNIYLCLLLILLFFNSYLRLFKISSKYEVFLVVIIVLLTILSKNRAGMLGLGILLLYMSKDIKQIRVILLIGCTIFISLLLSDVHFLYIESFFSDTAQNQVGGSSIEMRKNQLDIVLLWLLKSPFWGLGTDAVIYIRDFDYSLYGAESIWFRLLLERGILGLITYIYVIIVSYFSFTNRQIRKYFSYVIIYWLAINSVTLSSTGLLYPFLLVYIILFKSEKILSVK